MNEHPQDPRNIDGPGAAGQPGAGRGLSGAPPGLALAARLSNAAGPGARYRGLGDDAVIVAAGRWHAVEAWVFAQKLTVVREAIRRRPLAGKEPKHPDGLPTGWRKDLAEELALELAVTKNAADKLITLAWVLETRLPLTAAALGSGILDASKARMIADETAVLSDEDAGKAEALIAGKWQGKTWSQIRRMIVLAVVNVDPEGAERRRKQAEREEARVRFWREHAGTAGLAAYGLPADRALKAHAKIQARARAYRAWGIPGTMDQLRVLAYLDKLLDADSRDHYPKTPAAARHRNGRTRQHGQDGHPANDRPGRADDPDDDSPSQDADHPDADDPDDSDSPDGGDGSDSGDGPDGEDGGHGPGGPGGSDSGGPDSGGPDSGGPDSGGPDSGGPDGSGGPAGGGADDGLPANVDLTIPLRDLLDRAQRAGEAHGLGVLDPDLARRLAAEAARNPRSSFRVIITGAHGRAIGFGLGQAARTRRPTADKPPRPGQPRTGDLPDSTPMAAFAPAGAGPRDGYGTWTLTIADRVFSVRLHPIPDGQQCDHRYESTGYQPSDTLRRLVEIRDGECAMPVCVRRARGSDWEHAVPWPNGRTCCCNGGYHCRHDHHIKQSPGWKIKQLPDGRRTWTTPAGLSYTSQPWEYPT